MRNKTVCLYTLGCRTNQSESASIQKSFEDLGFQLVDTSTPADYAVINTCTVTAKGDSDTRKMVHKLTRLHPNVQIALIGCQVQIQKDKLLKLPNVKWIIGTEEKMQTASIIFNSKNNTEQIERLSKIQKNSFTVSPQSTKTRQTRANIKIQDGCDAFCSYCDVPYARGRSRSRVFEDIIKEAKRLSKAGFQEVIITGINVGKYHDQGKKLFDVVDALEQIEKIKRIRISSIEFKTISQKLINKMTKQTKLCHYLHIPLQSASDTILKSMNRQYTFDEFKNFVWKVHNTVPNICLGSDIIVGFPQETESLFNQTKKRIEELPLAYLHVFSYSHRNMAKSKDFLNPVDQNEITRRSQLLRKLSLEKRTAYFQSQLGGIEEVLFEQKKGDYWLGLTENYMRVKAKSDRNLSNVFKNVELRKIDGETIIAFVQ